MAVLRLMRDEARKLVVSSFPFRWATDSARGGVFAAAGRAARKSRSRNLGKSKTTTSPLSVAPFGHIEYKDTLRINEVENRASPI